MRTFSATLPLPPRINATYRTTRHGGFYSAPEAKLWRENAYYILHAAGWRSLPQSTTALAIEYTMYVGKTRDAESSVKILVDAIAEALGVDDRIVTDIVIHKVVAPKAEWRVEVEVRAE